MNVLKYNITTVDGLALIAQATSSNPIIIVKSVTSANAASSESDLTTKGVSFYDGAEGTIQSSSASGNLATIVAKYINSGSTRQLVKSVAILARLQSQSAGQEVVLAAQSDPDSTIELPSIYDYAQKVFFQFNISFNAAGSVETTPDGCASIEDLDRMVSCHLAGQPTVGEDQDIYGDKTFKGDIGCDGNITCVNLYDNETWTNRIASNSASIELSKDMTPDTDNSIDLGSSAKKFKTVYTNGINGIAPIYSNGNLNIPIGGIVGLWLQYPSSPLDQFVLNAGDEITSGSFTYLLSIDDGVPSIGPQAEEDLVFRVLTRATISTAGTFTWFLAMRVG